MYMTGCSANANVKAEGFGCLSKFMSENAVNLLISKGVMLCKTMLMP